MSDENVITFTEQEIEESARRNKVIPLRTIKLEEYPILTVDMMEHDTPQPRDLVLHPILARQGIGWIYAATGLGKTLFSLNIAYAIASGGSFLKYTCPKPLKVLYVDGEMPYEQLHNRVMAIKKQQGDLDFQDNLHFLTPDKILPHAIPKIDDPVYGQLFYEKLLLEQEFDVVIFDNLSMVSSFDTNKGNEWHPIQDWLLRIRAMGITVIMIHHSGKDKNSYRGASNMMDCAEFAISLQPLVDNELEEEKIVSKKFNLVYTKNRNFHGADALPYEVKFLNGQWFHESMQKTTTDQIISMLNLKMSYNDISKELGINKTKICRLVKKAREIGLLPKD